jgi:lipoprotein NlpD
MNANAPPAPASSSVPQAPSNTPPPPATGPRSPPLAEAANAASPSVPSAAAPSAVASNGDVAWRWPADGRVVVTYVAGDQTRQGIDIAGKAGEPVRAAANGSVVYSGNGLIGYGELIIVKHSPGFLSAYGHNRKRLVKEGDHVDAGQVIAEMGSSSASRDSLHFEIRKNGKPVNPLDYLPRH